MSFDIDGAVSVTLQRAGFRVGPFCCGALAQSLAQVAQPTRQVTHGAKQTGVRPSGVVARHNWGAFN